MRELWSVSLKQQHQPPHQLLHLDYHHLHLWKDTIICLIFKKWNFFSVCIDVITQGRRPKLVPPVKEPKASDCKVDEKKKKKLKRSMFMRA